MAAALFYWLADGRLPAASSHGSMGDAPGVSPSVFVSSYKDTSHIGLGPMLMVSFQCKLPVSKFSSFLTYWGLELQRVRFGEDRMHPITVAHDLTFHVCHTHVRHTCVLALISKGFTDLETCLTPRGLAWER